VVVDADLYDDDDDDDDVPPLDSIRVMVNVWRLRQNIVRTAPLRAGLCDTVFTVSSTLM